MQDDAQGVREPAAVREGGAAEVARPAPAAPGACRRRERRSYLLTHALFYSNPASRDGGRVALGATVLAGARLRHRVRRGRAGPRETLSQMRRRERNFL
ncbi:hypothetical protein EVAR_84273_1 [Eumeta japonica]|uniref:Uncharacterized protein n=1 Tax=Eumeta variegata TaxID=151549 RepID=A0A4C1WUA1_EUMVA|nr:hypothetical protein EVAR_84273_1 [Eumeta japonica]